MTIDILHAKIYEGSPAKQKSVTWAPQLEPAAEASSKPSKKRAAPPRRKPAAKKRAGGGASKMRREARDPERDDHRTRRMTYAELKDKFDDYDETSIERLRLTAEQDNMSYNELVTLFEYMDSHGRVFCEEEGDGHCTLAGPERMRLWNEGKLKSAWQPLDHDEENELEDDNDNAWYEPVRRYLAESFKEGSVMFNSIYESVKMLHGNGIVDDTLDAHQLYDDLKRISPSVASEEAMRDKAEFEYFCGAWELMALVGRAPGRIFVLESSRTDYLRTDDIYCFEKDLDENDAWNGGVLVRRELKLSELDDLDDTDTFLLYNGENHYDSFVPYEGVELQPVEE